MASVQRGDLGPAERMLMGQAEALQAIFTSLAKRAAQNMGQYVDAADKYLRLALKGTEPVPRHAGNAGGDQEPHDADFCQAGQHRQRAATGKQRRWPCGLATLRARAGNRTSAERTIGARPMRDPCPQRLDRRTPTPAGCPRPRLETLGSGYRPAHRGRQGRVGAQLLQRWGARNAAGVVSRAAGASPKSLKNGGRDKMAFFEWNSRKPLRGAELNTCSHPTLPTYDLPRNVSRRSPRRWRLGFLSLRLVSKRKRGWRPLAFLGQSAGRQKRRHRSALTRHPA